MGRIAHVQVWDYVDKLRSSTSRVCVDLMKGEGFSVYTV